MLQPQNNHAFNAPLLGIYFCFDGVTEGLFNGFGYHD
jgi:hypothetical protein